MNTKELSETIWNANKNNKNENIPKDRILTEIQKIKVNDQEAYQFQINWSFCKALNADGYCSNSTSIEEEYTIIITSNDEAGKLIISFPTNNKTSQQILTTFKFIESLNN